METNHNEEKFPHDGAEGLIEGFFVILKSELKVFLTISAVILLSILIWKEDVTSLIAREDCVLAALTIFGIAVVVYIARERRKERIEAELRDQELKKLAAFNGGMEIIGMIAVIIVVVAPWMLREIIRIYPISSFLLFMMAVFIGHVIDRKSEREE